MQREWTETLRAASAVAKKKTACSRARIQCGQGVVELARTKDALQAIGIPVVHDL